MGIFEQIEMYGHEKVLFAQDKDTGLKCIIGVHDTTLGPAVGGTRIWNYANDDDALYDVLRLSQGMTMKNAAAGLAIGGGKAVIIGDAKKIKSEAFFKAYSEIINSLGGIYYTAEDVNTNTNDIDLMSTYTKFVCGTSGISSDPSPFTARGVFNGLRAGVKSVFGNDSLEGKTVAVQGLGNVGYNLCRHLHTSGAKLKVFDIDSAKVSKAVSEFGAEALDKDAILFTDCDVLAPCALGAVFNTDNIKSLKCKVIAGAANNVLTDAATGEAVNKMGILYMPDYIINSGGIINCSAEIFENYNVDEINKKVDEIYDTSLKIVKISQEKNIPTFKAADEYAIAIIEAAKKRK